MVDSGLGEEMRKEGAGGSSSDDGDLGSHVDESLPEAGWIVDKVARPYGRVGRAPGSIVGRAAFNVSTANPAAVL